jgi:hypothetical protein
VQPVYACQLSDNSPSQRPPPRWTANGPPQLSRWTEAHDPTTTCLVRVDEPLPAEGDSYIERKKKDEHTSGGCPSR